MTTLREAALMALEALESLHSEQNGPPLTRRSEEWGVAMTDAARAITTLHKALDADSMASLPEPVGWWLHTNAVGQQYFRKKPQDAVFNPQPLYTAPPLSMTISGDCATSRSSNRREWQGLTHEERDAICKDFVGDDDRVGAYRSLALEVEVRLTEKNK